MTDLRAVEPRAWTWEEERDAHNEDCKRGLRISIRAVNLVPSQMERLHRPAERPAPSKPRRRVVLKPHAIWIDEEVAAGRVTRWRSQSPASDWWAEWRPAVFGLLRLLLAVLIFGGAGWLLAVGLLVEGK